MSIHKKNNIANAEIFLESFQEIERILRSTAKLSENAKMYEVINRVEKQYPFLKTNKEIFYSLYALRNIYSHAKRRDYIAEVKNVAINQINFILKNLVNPPKVKDVFATEVFYATLQDPTQLVLREMQENLYTHIPVYANKHGWDFKGVLTETSILKWLNEKIKSGDAHFVKDYIRDFNLKYLEINDALNRTTFINENISIFEVPPFFEESINKGERLGAIFITSNGNSNEKPIGLVTAWDLPKIQEYYQVPRD